MDVMHHGIVSGNTKESRKSTPGTMMCLCCGGDYYIPFLRQYWSKHSCHFGESKEMDDMDDDCVVIYEAINEGKNNHKRSVQVKTVGKPKEKADGKPEEKTDDKPEEKTDDKPEEKTAGKLEEKTVSKPGEKVGGKPEEKADSKAEENADDNDDDCTIVYETIPGRKKRKRDNHTVVKKAIRKGRNKRKRDQAVQTSEDQESQEQDKNLQQDEEYFAQGLEPERILRAINVDGKLKFLVKWKNTSKSNWVSKEIVNEKYPKLVFNFYEGENSA